MIVVIYHHTKNLSDKVSDVRDIQKDIQIYMPEQIKKLDAIYASISKEAEKVEEISKAIEEDKNLISNMKGEIKKDVQKFENIQSALTTIHEKVNQGITQHVSNFEKSFFMLQRAFEEFSDIDFEKLKEEAEIEIESRKS